MLRSVRPKRQVDLPDDISPGRKSILKDETLYGNTVKMLIRVILVKLGFHMCSPCLYACPKLIPMQKKMCDHMCDFMCEHMCDHKCDFLLEV